jgi:hypothetical protein
VHQRCPHCRAPIPEHAARCPVCGRDPKQAPPAEPAAVLLAPRYASSGVVRPKREAGARRWRGAAALALVAVVALALGGAGALLDAAGMGEIAWPALAGLACALAAGAVVLVERQRARRVAATGAGESPPDGSAAADLALLYLHADHFATPAGGRGSVRAPLAGTRVSAEELAWRGVAVTLTTLAEREIVELDAHALATPAGPVPAVAVRLVRPLPAGEAFAARLLRPLTRRGVGGSSIVSDLVGQLVLARRPAATVLALAREQALARGDLLLPGTLGKSPGAAARGWLAAALLLPPRVAPARLADPDPALAALDERLAAWDAREPALVAALQVDVCAAFLRERARASHGAA